MGWLKHAFAIDPPGPATPSDDQRALIERLCQEVNRRRLTTPALAFLEMVRPLNHLGSQAMHFFTPIISAIADVKGYERFASFLERRGSIEYICRRLEDLDRA